MFISNGNSGVVGGLKGINNGFTQCLTKLKESFDAESNMDYASDITQILKHQKLHESYLRILMEDYANEQSSDEFLAEMHADNYAKLEQLMENSRDAILSEAQQTGTLAPYVGLTLPLLKVYWIKNVFKDFVSTSVATEPAVKLGIERQVMIDADGVKHMLPDVFMDPDLNMNALSRKKLIATDIAVPQIGYDLITQSGGSVAQDDSVSKLFYISEITYADPLAAPPATKTKKVRVKADAGSGIFRYVLEEVTTAGQPAVVYDILQGDIDFATGTFNLASNAGKITKLKVDGYLSTENHLRTMSVNWEKEMHQFDIPDGDHLSTGLTMERIKDEKVIYNIDSTSKVIGQMNDVLGQMKDGRIKRFLEDSRERLRSVATPYLQTTTFDCKPPSAITNMSPTDWSTQELKQTLDRLSLELTQVLQNENLMLSVIGNPLDIRLLENVQWMYGKDAEVGGCKLGYTIGLYNNQRNFLIGSSQKMKQGKIMILLTPLNDEQITYKLFEYQFFISNEYRDPRNVRVPAVMASDRYTIDEITPIQGEINILHNVISSSEIYTAG